MQGVLFDVAFLPSAGAAQVACVVSKKAALRAVDRNRVRRRVRAVLVDIRGSLKPYRLVFTAKPPAKTADFASTKADIVALVARADVSYNGRI